jgi:hypothetical protein
MTRNAPLRSRRAFLLGGALAIATLAVPGPGAQANDSVAIPGSIASVDSPLVAPRICQRFAPGEFTGQSVDVGTFDCVPASAAMILQTLQGGGVLPLSVATDYPSIRRAFRRWFPNAEAGIFPRDVPAVVGAITHRAVSAHVVQLAATDWLAFLDGELSAGRPALVIVGDWSALAGRWSPAGLTHAIVVTGLGHGRVSYNDPWDGGAYTMTMADFARAWGQTASSYLAIPIRSVASRPGS